MTKPTVIPTPDAEPRATLLDTTMENDPVPPGIEESQIELPVLKTLPGEEKAGRQLVRGAAMATITVCVLVHTLHFARPFLLPLAMATMLNLILGPVVRRLKGWGVPLALGAVLVVGGLVTTLTTIAVIAAPQVQGWAREMPKVLGDLKTEVLNTDSIRAVLQASEQADDSASIVGQDMAIPVRMETNRTSEYLMTGSGFMGEIIIVLFLALLMLVAGDRVRKRARTIFEGSPLSTRIRAAAEEMEEAVSAYVLTISAINLGLGVCVGIALWLFGLEDPLLWGVMAGLLNFIPYLGPIVTASLVALAGFAQTGTLEGMFIPALVYLAVNAVEAFVITPMMLGKQLALSPVAALVSVFFWGWLWGIGGALVAIPFLVIVYCISAQIAPLRPVAALLTR